MAEIREITSGLLYPEGPVGMDDGSVIVTELQTGRLVRVQTDGKKEVVILFTEENVMVDG